jgi:hypothetical protein
VQKERRNKEIELRLKKTILSHSEAVSKFVEEALAKAVIKHNDILDVQLMVMVQEEGI